MKDGTKKLAVGAVVAGLAGYLTGLLTAPKSGKETRKDIADKAVQFKQEAEKTLKTLHSELDELLVQAKKVGIGLKDKAAAEFADVVSKAQFAKEKAREMLSALHEGDTDDKDLKKAVSEVKKATEHLKTYLKKHPIQKT
jgi:gas vesicle protein